ncbi:MAG TPA: serine hydrolase domain-containing protein [Caulobacteraceae bacterium]|nr:serine hydrolase domain-containing protein [Caulobacteraceae bacterium]
MIEVSGVCPDRFERVRAAFGANFAEDLELGARFSIAIEGELIIDLWAGHADRARTLPFAEDTLTAVFSTTKAMAALMMARLVDAGALAYDQPVARVWPEFAAAGKTGVSVGEALSHQAGLAGLRQPMEPARWFDWAFICAELAAMAPLWPPGSASGYHPVTFGYLAGEIFRRVDGRSLAKALAADLAEPFGLDLMIGVPEAEQGRCAAVQRPPAMPDLGEITEVRRLAFLAKWASPGGVSLAQWRGAEIPSVTGHATAPALARMMAIVACGGRLAGRQWLSPATIEALCAERIAGPDLVLPYDLSWAAGLLRNERLGIYGPGQRTVGHSGWGGSCAFADPERRLSGAYVMNRQSAALIGDPRPRRLIDAVYACF